MTDSEQKSGGLPTAAIVDESSWNEYFQSHTIIASVPRLEAADFEEGDKLVRRKDVKNLIQDKIEKLHNLNTQFQEEHRDIPYPVKENIDQIKKDLLEELEGEAL